MRETTTSYAYVARVHLDPRASNLSLVHFRSLAELAEWAEYNSMAPGLPFPGSNLYRAERADGSPLTPAERQRLPGPRRVPTGDGRFVTICQPDDVSMAAVVGALVLLRGVAR